MIPPKPKSRPGRVSLWRYMKLFRQDILSAQPEKLFRAWMAEFKTPFFRSYLVNEPALVKRVLKDAPDDFPKSDRVAEGLRPLLGNSVFVTNGDVWKRQRRIIDPAFEGGRLREIFPAMWDATQAAVDRLQHDATSEPIDIEQITSFAAADVIFRTLFSLPIEDKVAQSVFHAFKAYQRDQPVLNLGALIRLPKWVPRGFRKSTVAHAEEIRGLIRSLTEDRLTQIENGVAPDDLATKIMTTPDPLTGDIFDRDEMVDQVAIFFLAGHETSASALAWALYLLAANPEWQDRVAAEGAGFGTPEMAALSGLRDTRDVFRETLRLYPPVPMMVRETQADHEFRNRRIRKGAQIVLSPWHLHRHQRLWDAPDAFDPTRWDTENGKQCQRDAYMPFSSGPRVCTGAGFAMMEGVMLLSKLVAAYRFDVVEDARPVPVAHLTIRGKDGIMLRVTPR